MLSKNQNFEQVYHTNTDYIHSHVVTVYVVAWVTPNLLVNECSNTVQKKWLNKKWNFIVVVSVVKYSQQKHKMTRGCYPHKTNIL